MSGSMNSADGVVLHAVAAICSMRVRDQRRVASFVDDLREAVPHTSDHIDKMQPVLSVAIELIDRRAPYFDGSTWFVSWSLRAAEALELYHRHTCGELQARMRAALASRAA